MENSNTIQKIANDKRTRVARAVARQDFRLIDLIRYLRSDELNVASPEWAFALSIALIAPNSARTDYELTFSGLCIAGKVAAPIA